MPFKSLFFYGFLSILVSTTSVYAQQDLGVINFPTSGDRVAQSHFERGVLLLHSFEYDDAGEAFRDAQAAQPDFAMAYWGEVMTLYRPIWNQLFTEQGQAILKTLAPTPQLRQDKALTIREQEYLAAVEILFGSGEVQDRLNGYSQAMRRLHERFPADDEAATFYALSILGTQRGTRDFTAYMKAAGIAEQVFARNPKHPGAAHYLIHSYDDPIHAPVGLRAAEVYADIAPAASHALHMPSHIFVAMGMWDRVASSNEDAWQAAEDRRLRKGLGKRARSYHALAWLSYAYLQQGRFAEARDLIRTLEDDLKEDPTGGMRGYLIAMKATYLVNSEQWSSDVARIDVGGDDFGLRNASVDLFTSGVAFAQTGELDQARSTLQKIRDLRAEDERGGENAIIAEVLEKELKSLILVHEGYVDQAADLLSQTAELEEGMSFEFGPPAIPKPSHELLGEVLIQAGRYREAVAAFEKALSRAPRRSLSLRGLALASASANDLTTARATYSELQSITVNADVKIPSWEVALENIND